MKIGRLLMLPLALALLGSPGSAHAADSAGAASPARSVMIIGHRGLGQKHSPEPENSILALTEALRRGATAVEFDVQLTSDGQVILAHDPKLERMTDGQGCVARQSLAGARRLHLRDGSKAIHPELGMATLAEALEAIRPFDDPSRPFLADIHIKVYDGFHGDRVGLFDGQCPKTRFRELTESVVAITRASGLGDRVVYTSFDERVVEQVRSLDPHARTGLISLFPEHAIKKARGSSDFVAVAQPLLRPDDQHLAHEAGLGLLVWSPSQVKQMSEDIHKDGVDGLITDNLENALQSAKP